MKTAENLKLWTMPANYFGAEYPEYYVILSQTRDSHPLERANFDAMTKLLGGESKHSNAVIIARASHWACGWVETIFVHQSASKKVTIADQAIGRYNDYPVINDDLYSQYDQEEKQQLWDSLDLRERMQICVKAGLSCIAARHDYIPGDCDQYLEV